MYTPLEELVFEVIETPDYKWEVEAFPRVFYRCEKRPALWKRFWFRVFF